MPSFPPEDGSDGIIRKFEFFESPANLILIIKGRSNAAVKIALVFAAAILFFTAAKHTNRFFYPVDRILTVTALKTHWRQHLPTENASAREENAQQPFKEFLPFKHPPHSPLKKIPVRNTVWTFYCFASF